jgi:hypothetical protein
MTICNKDFSEALSVIGKKIGQKIGAPCVNGVVLDTEGGTWKSGDPNPPDCAVVDHKAITGGGVSNTPLAHCDNNTPGATECWTLEDGGTTCPGAHIVAFNRPGQPAATDLNSTVSCSIRTCPIGHPLDMNTGECN